MTHDEKLQKLQAVEDEIWAGLEHGVVENDLGRIELCQHVRENLRLQKSWLAEDEKELWRLTGESREAGNEPFLCHRCYGPRYPYTDKPTVHCGCL